MAGRSLRASATGIQIIRKAIKHNDWKQNELKDELELKTRQPITRLLAGKPIERSTFEELCHLLDLEVKDVAVPETEQPEQPRDIDALVQQVRSRACIRVLNLYSKIRLLNRQEIEVDSLYVDVYMLESRAFHATISGLLEGRDQRDSFNRLAIGERGLRSPGLEIAAQKSRLMVFGQPGAGKSTFLRYLAVTCAKEKFLPEYIPVLFELRDIKDASKFDLWKLLEQEFRLSDRSQIQQILDSGRILLLLDGLDEMPKALQKTVQDCIWEFVKKLDNNRFILTCRTQTTEYVLPTFDPVEVAEFKPEQVEAFAQKWFERTSATPAEGTALKERFMAKLRENQPTAELAVTPILLSLMCWVFDDLKDLPLKRSELYQQGIDLLLKQWDEKRGIERESGSDRYRQLSPRNRQELLSYIAVRKFEREQYIVFEHSELVQYIADYLKITIEEGEIVLKDVAIQHGLLFERAQGIWSFSHLTFQEYFAAKWFCNQSDWASLIRYVSKEHWREIFLITVENLINPNLLLQMIKDEIDHLMKSDETLQDFLVWVNNKSCSVKKTYNPATRFQRFYFRSDYPELECKQAAIRAFYFDLALVHNKDFAQPLYQNIIYEFDNNFGLSGAADHRLSSEFELSCAIDSSLASYLHFASSLAFIGADDLAIDAAIDSNIEFVYGRIFNSEFRESIRVLKDQLPTKNEGINSFEKWMNSNGRAWSEQLRSVVIKYRKLGDDWQFNEKQEQLLQQYYYANKLLMDCLNSGCAVSDDVRQEIEETLLLPLAEIEKRKNIY